MRKLFMGLTGWACLACAGGAHAAGSDEPDAPAGTGISLLLGIDFGYGVSAPEDSKTESDKSGYLVGGKALLSLFTDAVAGELGAGWFYNELAGDPQPARDGKQDNRYVRSRLGFAEAAARYRFGGGPWELGGVAQMLFGDDSSFSPFRSDNDKTSHVLAGPQLAYAWKAAHSFDNRVTLQALTDVSINDRQVTFVTLGYAFGIPLVRPGVRVEVHETVRETVREKVRVEREERYIVESEYVNFATDRSDLSPRAQEFLRRFGAWLATHDDAWETMVIGGHTDVRGTMAHNQALAEKRAAAVKEALLAQNVPEAKLKTRVYGPRVPVDGESDAVALARNRRVEMAFVGKTRIAEVRRFLGQLKQQMNVPETCAGNECQ